MKEIVAGGLIAAILFSIVFAINSTIDANRELRSQVLDLRVKVVTLEDDVSKQRHAIETMARYLLSKERGVDY